VWFVFGLKNNIVFLFNVLEMNILFLTLIVIIILLLVTCIMYILYSKYMSYSTVIQTEYVKLREKMKDILMKEFIEKEKTKKDFELENAKVCEKKEEDIFSQFPCRYFNVDNQLSGSKILKKVQNNFNLKLLFKVPEEIEEYTLLYFLDNPVNDTNWRTKKYFEDEDHKVYFPESNSILYHNQKLKFKGVDKNLKFYYGKMCKDTEK